MTDTAFTLNPASPDPNRQTPITELDRRMMDRALALADQAAQIGEVPVGAVVYRTTIPTAAATAATPDTQVPASIPGDDEHLILGTGYNLRESTADPLAHAEVIAIRQAAAKLGTWRLDDCTLVVTLEPCPMCAGALVNARVSRLIYGAKDPKAGCVDSLHQLCTDSRFNHRLKVASGLCAEQAAEQLKSFFRARRKGQTPPPKPKPKPKPKPNSNPKPSV